MKKYFDFSDSILGLTYFYRIIISSIYIAVGFDSDVFSLLMLVAGVWMHMSTVVKRIRAILPEYAVVLFLSSLVLGFSINFVCKTNLLFLPYIVFLVWITFVRSDTFYHEG